MRILDRPRDFGERLAVVDGAGEHRYTDLLAGASQVAARLLARRDDLAGERVAFMVDPSARWVETLWGTWLAGGVAVPLCLSHPAAELRHALAISGASQLVVDTPYVDVVGPVAAELGIPVVGVTGAEVTPPDVGPERRALMLFTSGTTGRPKGVVTTHANISAQIESLVEAWEWSTTDRILLTLPLHHLHGILNVVSCALWSGAVCEMHPRFDAVATWERIASGDLTLYMGVPTVYHRLISAWEGADPPTQRRWAGGARRLRLMVSGSAALPVPVLERWEAITGHVLLERYGMTEIGMALSNPLHGSRRPGFVGMPLPGVEARLTGEDGAPTPAGDPGGLEVRGPGVFAEYWEDPAATTAAFTADGWFRTGDVVEIDAGSYRILGRSSVDILKSGGEKVSALEIESVLLGHPRVDECAVVGVEDAEWGQRIVAAVVGAGSGTEAAELAAWCRERLAPFKVPKAFVWVDELPRNAMGKVQKPAVAALVR